MNGNDQYYFLPQIKWLGVPPECIVGAVKAAPAGDQGANRDGLGLDERFAGLSLGTSIILSTETDIRPDGWQWYQNRVNTCFDPFMTSHGRFFNMGLYASGMRTGDPIFNRGMERHPKTPKGYCQFFDWIGEAALELKIDYKTTFHARFPNADPSLRIGKIHDVESEQPLEMEYLLFADQQGFCIRKRLESLCGNGKLPDKLIVGGAASKDDKWLQLIANATNLTLLRPEGAEFAPLHGNVDRARLAEELAHLSDTHQPKPSV